MAYNHDLAERIRYRLTGEEHISEKEMFGGIAFMKNDKMCVGVIGDELMCRIDPARYEDVLERNGCREMDFTGKPMLGWVMVEEAGFYRPADFEYWIDLSLSYNSIAKPARKRIRKGKV